ESVKTQFACVEPRAAVYTFTASGDRVRRSVGALLFAVGIVSSVNAQRADTTQVPGAFYGRLISAADSSTIPRAEIRLLRIDSTRKTKNRLGLDSVEVFVDSSRAR